MEKRITYQKLRRGCRDDFSVAQRYYDILSALNGLELTEREIQLVAFVAVKGNIMGKELKDEFCEKYNSTSPTVNNIVSRLKKKGVLKREEKKIVVEPAIALNFENNVLLEIRIVHEEA